MSFENSHHPNGIGLDRLDQLDRRETLSEAMRWLAMQKGPPSPLAGMLQDIANAHPALFRKHLYQPFLAAKNAAPKEKAAKWATVDRYLERAYEALEEVKQGSSVEHRPASPSANSWPDKAHPDFRNCSDEPSA